MYSSFYLTFCFIFVRIVSGNMDDDFVTLRWLDESNKRWVCWVHFGD